MDADAQAFTFPGSNHAGSLHRVIELIDASSYPLHEVPACVCQPNTARMTLEQHGPKVFFQCFHARASP
ncbi:hypothetical protein D3C87_1965190 [compost metagenome]